jgi:hypothetical protein
MEDYYKVLHHLREFKVDRQYPFPFDSADNVQPSSKVEVVSSDVVHENILQFTDLDGDILLIPTIQRDYFTIDFAEIKLLSDAGNINPSEITLKFHDSLNSDVALLSVTGSGETISQGSMGSVLFTINEQSMDPKTSVLAGVKSVSIHLNQSLSSIQVHDIVFRCRAPSCTLEGLDTGISDGENYVLDGIEEETIPTSLTKYKYMAAAALIWLSKWEHQGHVMGDGKQVNKNYADRLLGIVDRALDSPVSSDDDDSEADINESLIGSSFI